MKFTKIGVLLFSLGMSSLSFAGMYAPPAMPAPQPSVPTSNDGLYVGIGLGGLGLKQESTSGTMTSHDLSTGSSLTENTTISGNQGDIGLNSTLFVGYAWHLPKHFFLGTEAFGNLTNTSATSNMNGVGGVTLTPVNQDITISGDGTGSSELTLQTVYGLRVLPGYQVAPNVTVYGILGWSNAHTKLTTTNGVSTTTNDGADPVNASESSSQNLDFNGYQVGVGSMFNVTEHVLIRGDIIYSGYGSKTVQTLDTDEFSESVSAKPSTLEANVSLVYLF